MLAFSCCHSVTAKGWHSPTGSPMAAGLFVTGRPCARSSTVRTHSVFCRPRRAVKLSDVQFGRHVDLCQSSTSASAHDSLSSAHVSKASYIEAVHELHQHLQPVVGEMLRAQVRRVSFPKGSSSPPSTCCCGPPPGPQVLDFQCALLCPSPFYLLWTVLPWCQCAAESERLPTSLANA